MRLTRHLRACLAVVLGFAALSAHAVLITFDDLPRADPAQPDSRPVTDEYAALGLIVNNGYLAAAGWNGPDQSLIGAPHLSVSFTGALPTFVSLSVSSYFHDKVTVNAWGTSGILETKETEGLGGPPGTQTPYRPDQYVSFSNAAGIAQLELGASFFRRYGAYIDDLYFGNSPPVPEPAPFVLAAIGAAVLAWRKRRLQRRDTSGGSA